MRVLVVDDDEGIRDTFAFALRHSGFETYVAADGRQAIHVASQTPTDVALIDLCLPDMSGLSVLHEFRASRLSRHVLIMTGFGSTQTAVEAMRLGARDYIEKPIYIDALVDLLHNVLRDSPDDSVKLHAATRWAHVVTMVIDAPSDPKTLQRWGRSVGASPGAIRNWCHTVHVRAKRSLDFGRVLRAVIRQHSGILLEDLFDVVDLRTLTHLLRMGRTTSNHTPRLPRSVEEFLGTQQWITQNNLLDEIRRQLRLRETNNKRAI